MTGFDRRWMIKAAVATGTALCVPASLRAAASSPGVFVVDRRFAASAAAASDRAASGALVIDSQREDEHQLNLRGFAGQSLLAGGPGRSIDIARP